MTSFMQRFQHSRSYPRVLRALRVLQLLSTLVSLILFSLRVRKLISLYHQLNRATGAVEGILAAAILYTIIATLLTFLVRGRSSSVIRWILVALDIAFVAAFIAVAVLTSPKNGSGGLGCYGHRKEIAAANDFVDDPYCQLPLGTFITAIISTLLHALTATFHSVRDHTHDRHVTERDIDGDLTKNVDSTNVSHHNGARA